MFHVLSYEKKKDRGSWSMSIVGKKIVLRISPGLNNPRNSEGDFIQLTDGRLAFIYSYFTGNSPTDNDPACLAARYSNDGGYTWSEESEVILKKEGQINTMSVSLLRLQNGKIALFYLNKNSMFDCMPLMRTTTDEAQTWSEPVPIITNKKGYYVLNNDRVIQLQSGRLLVPVSLFKTADSEWSNIGRLWSYFSDDNGKTWSPSMEISNPDGVILQEPGVVELKDGRIMMFIRSSAGVQYQSFSNDQGETWCSAKAGKIPSPLSSASIKRIPTTGDLLLVWNKNGGHSTGLAGKRTPLNIAVSKDEGNSWQNIKTVEGDPNGWYSYTALHFGPNRVFLGYCAGKNASFDAQKSMETGTGLSTTYITSLNIDWIYGSN